MKLRRGSLCRGGVSSLVFDPRTSPEKTCASRWDRAWSRRRRAETAQVVGGAQQVIILGREGFDDGLMVGVGERQCGGGNLGGAVTGSRRPKPYLVVWRACGIPAVVAERWRVREKSRPDKG